MADMFPGSSALGESIQELFSSPQSSMQSNNAELMALHRQNYLTGIQNQGVKDMPSYGQGATANSPQYGNEKNRPATSATEDPQAVEDRWTARLAKFAGIANDTGVKLGGK